MPSQPLEGRSESCHEILTAPLLQIRPYSTDHCGPRTLTELSPTPHEGRRPQETASLWKPSHSMYRNNTENHCCGLRAGSLSVGMDISKKCVCTPEHMPRSEYSLRRGAHTLLHRPSCQRSSSITDMCYHTCLYLDPGDSNSGPRTAVCVFPTQSWPQPQKSLLFGCCLCLLGCSTMLILDHKGPKI